MTGSPLPVRKADLPDSDGIADVHVQSWRETYTGLISDQLMGVESLEGRRHLWSSILGLDSPPGTVVAPGRDREVVGFAFAGPASHPDATKGFPRYAACIYIPSTFWSLSTAPVPVPANLSWRLPYTRAGCVAKPSSGCEDREYEQSRYSNHLCTWHPRTCSPRILAESAQASRHSSTLERVAPPFRYTP